MYTRILVPVDDGGSSDRGLAEAIRLGLLTGARLCLVHVVDINRHVSGFEPPAVYEEASASAMAAGHRLLEERSARVGTASGLAPDAVLPHVSKQA